MHIAEIDEKFPGPRSEIMSSGLVKKGRMEEKDSGDDEACRRGRPEEKGNDFFAVMNEKIAQSDGSDPGNRSQNAALRASSLPVGEKGVVQEKRKADKEKTPKDFSPLTIDFHEAKQGEKIEGRVQKKPIPLVEKIIQEGLCPSPEGNGQDGLFESFCPLGRQGSFVDGDR